MRNIIFVVILIMNQSKSNGLHDEFSQKIEMKIDTNWERSNITESSTADTTTETHRTQNKKTKKLKFEIHVHKNNTQSMMNSSQLETTYENCHITYNNFDENVILILGYLKTLCESTEHSVDQNRFHPKNCIIEDDEKNTKYIISQNSYKMNYTVKSHKMQQLCKNLTKQIIKTEAISDSAEIACLNVSINNTYTLCCQAMLKFIPRDILHRDGVIKSWESSPAFSVEIGYMISVFCLIIIFITALFSKTYRDEKGNQILVHFAFSIFAQVLLHLAACWITTPHYLCIYEKLAFHYFTLLESAWTSIIAYFQYKRYVKVFDKEPDYLILKLVLIAYSYPVLPIFIRVLLPANQEIVMEYVTFCAPKLITLIFNTFMLVLIVKNIVFLKNEFIEHRKSLSMEVKLIFFLFFVLDFSWFALIFSFFTSVLCFFYLFLFAQAIQGFMLFFVFGVMNKHNRSIYKKFFIVIIRIMFFKRSRFDGL